jgi:hypothetical protein
MKSVVSVITAELRERVKKTVEPVVYPCILSPAFVSVLSNDGLEFLDRRLQTEYQSLRSKRLGDIRNNTRKHETDALLDIPRFYVQGRGLNKRSELEIANLNLMGHGFQGGELDFIPNKILVDRERNRRGLPLWGYN